ncbi:MAG TPA: glycosyltransferase family 4 protein [Chitinispirillaceae bacterium]|nr:glycosyltransferase family 4 protein [Chitinispirillaceae bacterium]
MQKMKILHVYKSFDVYNGLIEILTILAQNLDYQKFELGVCVNQYHGNCFGEKFEKLGAKIFNMNIEPGFGSSQHQILELNRFFKNYGPQVVQTHVLKSNLFGTIAAKMAAVPVVITTEMTLKDTAPTAAGRFRDRLVQPFVAYMIKKSDKFMVTSEYIKNQWFKGKNSSHCELIYPPFNLEKYDTAVRTPRMQIESIGKRVGFVGRLSEEKSVETLIRAMAVAREKIPDIGCTIVGTGPLEMQLKKCCDELGVSDIIEFTGYKENSFEALREMDVFVLPSRTEGCPIVILEAMAMGLPVVATDVGGNPELVSHNYNGILVNYGDIQQMADAICGLIINKKKAREIGQNGRRRAFSQFHPSSFSSKMMDMYQQLYNNKNTLEK